MTRHGTAIHGARRTTLGLAQTTPSDPTQTLQATSTGATATPRGPGAPHRHARRRRLRRLAAQRRGSQPSQPAVLHRWGFPAQAQHSGQRHGAFATWQAWYRVVTLCCGGGTDVRQTILGGDARQIQKRAGADRQFLSYFPSHTYACVYTHTHTRTRIRLEAGSH